MYFGKRFEDELLPELVRQRDSKRDLLVNTGKMSVIHSAGDQFVGQVTDTGGQALLESFSINPWAHKQLAARLKIPLKFYQRLRVEQPDLLEATATRLLQAEPEKRMARLLDGNLRAFLSNRYFRLDNYEVCAGVAELIGEGTLRDSVMSSCDVTDTRLYMKLTLPKIEAEVKVGDAVQMGMIITNSEVGCGRLAVTPFIKRLVCDNGMVVQDRAGAFYGRSHVGAQLRELGELESYSAETLRSETQTELLKLQDAIRALSQPEALEAIVAQMRDAATHNLTAQPHRAVEELAKTHDLTTIEQDRVLTSLIAGADFTRWGLLNAVTDASKDASSYDRATEMEQLGGRILAMTGGQWATLNDNAMKYAA